MNFPALLFHVKELRAFGACRSAGTIWMRVRVTRRSASCPLCGRRSRRVQSAHVRTLMDVPLSGEPVILRLQVHRFECETASCPRRAHR
jgi:transposase